MLLCHKAHGEDEAGTVDDCRATQDAVAEKHGRGPQARAIICQTWPVKK